MFIWKKLEAPQKCRWKTAGAQPSPAQRAAIHTELKYALLSLPTSQPNRRPLVLYLKGNSWTQDPWLYLKMSSFPSYSSPWTVYPVMAGYCYLLLGLKWLPTGGPQCRCLPGLSLAHAGNGNMKPSGPSFHNPSFSFMQAMAHTVTSQ